MLKGFIALIDSGVGGISTLLEMKKIMPNENYIYLGDNANAPYGEKSIRTLKKYLTNNLPLLNDYKVKAIVVACNTLSVCLREFVEDFCGVKTFGVYPSVHKHMIKGEKTLLLATPNTVKNYSNILGLDALSLPNLAIEIERKINDLNSVEVLSHLKKANCTFELYDTVVLGCTHYYFVKNQIINHLKPRKIDCCSNYTAQKVFEYLSTKNMLENDRKNQIKFIGDCASINQNFYSSVVNRCLK